MKLFKALLPLTAALLSGAAVAHPGGEHVHGFLAGAAHPLLGIDHLLVMLAVGIWSAQQAGQRVWLWPAAFVLAMLGGSMLGMAGVQLSWLETGIATSALLLGLLVAAAARLPQVLGAALCAAMASLHGIAHGAELPADTNAALFGLGFLAATVVLHLAGIGLTRALREMPSLARYFGGGIALTGGLMLLG
jgi:urease accessory protein